jgi:cellulose synthase/poly-beta-1,6-N-acetylglucosamine synthase-like glycosyltransferase
MRLKPLTDRLLIVGFATIALTFAWLTLPVAQLESVGFSVWIYALANAIVFADAIDVAIRLYMHRHNTHAGSTDPATLRMLSIDLAGGMPLDGRARSRPRSFAIVASVFNLEPRLEEFKEALLPYREHVWLISDGSRDHTLTRLRQAGWRCIDDGINRHKPGALRRLLQTLPAHIETVLVIDPDIRIRAPGEGSLATLERFVADFQRSGAAAVSPRVMIEPDGFLGRFQAFEYTLTFAFGRRSLADYSVSSGVCLYRRDALARALERHSLSVYAEDLETALILLAAGERIYYDGRLVVSTEGPGSWPRWFSQRVGWYYGLIKVYAERLAEIRRISARGTFATYQFVVYMGLLSILLHPLKMLSAVLVLLGIASSFDQLFALDLLTRTGAADPLYFATAFASYLLLGVFTVFAAVPRAERRYAAPVVPVYLFYVIANIAAMSIGFANWFALRLWGRRIYRDHYEPEQSDTEAPGESPAARGEA